MGVQNFRVFTEVCFCFQAVKELIEERHLVPNIKTYGCLAKACRSQADGNQLLADIEVGPCLYTAQQKFSTDFNIMPYFE